MISKSIASYMLQIALCRSPKQRNYFRVYSFCRCNCKNCHVQLLAGVMEYRCFKEMTPALRILTFDGSIERVDCITQHDDFGAMINPRVLEQVGPFFKDRNGRSYRRGGGQSRNE